MNPEQIFAKIPEFEPWIIQVIIVITTAFILDFTKRYLFSRWYRQFKKAAVKYDDVWLLSAQRPLSLLIWIIGLTFAVSVILRATHVPTLEAVRSARSIGVLFCLMWFLFSVVRIVQDRLIARHEQGDAEISDRTTIEAVGKLLRLALAITAVLITLEILGFSIEGILAFGGVGGIAIGFAAKDLLANFFGGVMIYLDRPFAEGDWIRSPDRSIEGTVEAIGWRLTRIRTFEKRLLYVPNSIFANIIVENPSRMTHRRIHETLSVRHEDIRKVTSIIEAIKHMLGQHPEIDNKETVIVNLNNITRTAADFFIYAFTKTTDWAHYHKIKEDILIKTVAIINANHAEIAYPVKTVQFSEKLQVLSIEETASFQKPEI